MEQLANFAGAAKQVTHLVHDNATAGGLEPIPTAIIVGLVALFALVSLVVGGADRRPRGAHRA